MKPLLFHHFSGDDSLMIEEADSARPCDGSSEFESLVFAPEAHSPNLPELQCLSLIRRQQGKTISMKLVLRSHAAE